MIDPALRRWAAAGVIGLVVVLIVIPLSRMGDRSMPSLEPGSATFVGTAACVDCHRTAAEAWTGSDHDLGISSQIRLNAGRHMRGSRCVA